MLTTYGPYMGMNAPVVRSFPAESIVHFMYLMYAL